MAFLPDAGDVIAGAGGVRQLMWPSQKPAMTAQVIYYFRDVNMPLFLLAVYREGEFVNFDEEWRTEMEKLVNELLRQYSKQWARALGRPDSTSA